MPLPKVKKETLPKTFEINGLKVALQKALGYYFQFLKFPLGDKALKKYFLMYSAAKNDVELYKIALDMLKTGPEPLKFITATLMSTNEEIYFEFDKCLILTTEEVSKGRRFSEYKKLEEFAKSDKGKNIIQHAMSTVEELIPLERSSPKPF